MLLTPKGTLVPSLSSMGDRMPMLANASYYASTALQLSGPQWAAYAALYKRQLWVNVLVSKLANAHARLPFGIRLRDGDGWKPEHGDLDALLRRPNPQLSGYQFWTWFSSTYDIYGEAFAYKVRDKRGRVREIWPLHPETVRIERDETGALVYVREVGVAGPNGYPRFPQSDIIAAVSYNPENMARGLSKLEPLRMTLLNEDASRRATSSFWQRGARPGFMLSTDGNLSEGAIQRLKAQIDDNHSGADNTGGNLVLEEGLKPQLVQLNLEEMQYIESRKLNREEACAAYDVPPPVVHILDHATFSNITEQLRSLYRDTMAPRNEMFESVIDHQLVTDFYPDGEAESRFDMDEVLRGDFEKRAEAVGALIEKGVYKPSEARPLFGLAPAGPEADRLYGNAALVPLGSNTGRPPVATDGTLIPQPLDPAPIPAKAVQPPAVRALMGRLSQVKASGKQATRAKLVDEHVKELAEFFARQKAAVLGNVSKAAGLFAPADWDDELAGILSTLSTATTLALGSATAAELGGKFDAAPIADWLEKDARTSAVNLNATTAAAIKARQDLAAEDEDLELDDAIENLFDGEIAARADEIAVSRVGMLAGFASLVAAEQSGASRKTWIVTSANPRPSHAAVNGETVALSETFSNGLNAPGDFTGGADEVAGCTCEMQFEFEE